jgi:hypothetical protein
MLSIRYLVSDGSREPIRHHWLELPAKPWAFSFAKAINIYLISLFFIAFAAQQHGESASEGEQKSTREHL